MEIAFPPSPFSPQPIIKHLTMKLITSKILAATVLLAAANSMFALTFTASTVTVSQGNGNAPSIPANILYSAYNPTHNGYTEGGTKANAYSTDDLGDTRVKVEDNGPGSTINVGSLSSLYLLAIGESDANPDWKVFDLKALGWNGSDDLRLDKIFNSPGFTVHNITFPIYYDINALYISSTPFGNGDAVVARTPDAGSTLVLLGSALAALGLVSRRRKS